MISCTRLHCLLPLYSSPSLPEPTRRNIIIQYHIHAAIYSYRLNVKPWCRKAAGQYLWGNGGSWGLLWLSDLLGGSLGCCSGSSWLGVRNDSGSRLSCCIKISIMTIRRPENQNIPGVSSLAAEVCPSLATAGSSAFASATASVIAGAAVVVLVASSAKIEGSH
jgi:hypothetical protein